VRTTTTQAYILALLAAALTLSLVFYPDASLDAARDGLDLFTTVVFPSLLPFFILSELLLGLGVVHFIGVLFEPLMRPVFNVPGEGAFALSMGLAAGYPMDAVITGRFRRMNLCNRVEGERLLAFTNTADPLFIFGAVAVGMFGLPALGAALALAHYLSALGVGLVFRFHDFRTEPTVSEDKASDGHIISRAARALLRAREEDGRPLGRILGIVKEEEKPPRHPVSTVTIEASSNEDLPHSLDIHGMTQDEAYPVLEKYIDAANLAGWPQVYIIHGHGMGGLRRMVQRLLEKHPLVHSYRAGDYMEGGTGVTVAILREG